MLLRGVDEELGDLVAFGKHDASLLYWHELHIFVEAVREELASLRLKFFLVFLLLCHVRSIVELGLESTPFKMFFNYFSIRPK